MLVLVLSPFWTCNDWLVVKCPDPPACVAGTVSPLGDGKNGGGDKACEVYVYEVPTSGKIAIALGQVPTVCLICYMVFRFSKSVMGVGENWKWTVFELVAGFNDVVSDFTTLYLIPWRNPFNLFQVSLFSLGVSVTTSLVLSFYSRIKLPWPTRFFIFISGTAESFEQDCPEKWNTKIVSFVEDYPQLVIQAILWYVNVNGSQGSTGWDWAILVQNLAFTLTSISIKYRKLVKDCLGRRGGDPDGAERVIEGGGGGIAEVVGGVGFVDVGTASTAMADEVPLWSPSARARLGPLCLRHQRAARAH
jgi:hypothetical protein